MAASSLVVFGLLRGYLLAEAVGSFRGDGRSCTDKDHRDASVLLAR